MAASDLLLARDHRPHEDFVFNFAQPVEEIKSGFTEVWQAKTAMQELPLARLEKLVMEKYSLDSWNYRR